MIMKKVSGGNSWYETPQLSVLEIATEAGFALSDGAGLPGENPNFNDYGEF